MRSQVSRDDGGRRALSAAPGHLTQLEDSLLQRRHGRPADHRAEEAEFLANMPGFLGSTAMAALRQVHSIVGLDYGGIDFGINAHGEILLFEANATMVVEQPDEDHDGITGARLSGASTRPCAVYC